MSAAEATRPELPMTREAREYEDSAAKNPCKHCGSQTVAWQKSRKSGKFYLTEIFNDRDGDLFTGRALFHSYFCGKPAEHEKAQDEILAKEKKNPLAGYKRQVVRNNFDPSTARVAKPRRKRGAARRETPAAAPTTPPAIPEPRKPHEVISMEEFLALNDLAENDPEQGRAELMQRRAKLDAELAQPASMDQFVDFIRWTELLGKLRAEIEILECAIDAAEAD
jgi:ssDNA-binding Zn-finger/Zn-ribbon topoisomerase 1